MVLSCSAELSLADDLIEFEATVSRDEFYQFITAARLGDENRLVGYRSVSEARPFEFETGEMSDGTLFAHETYDDVRTEVLWSEGLLSYRFITF
jgi:hypothetical protein